MKLHDVDIYWCNSATVCKPVAGIHTSIIRSWSILCSVIGGERYR